MTSTFGLPAGNRLAGLGPLATGLNGGKPVLPSPNIGQPQLGAGIGAGAGPSGASLPGQQISMQKDDLDGMKLTELKDLARGRIPGFGQMNKDVLLPKLRALRAQGVILTPTPANSSPRGAAVGTTQQIGAPAQQFTTSSLPPPGLPAATIEVPEVPEVPEINEEEQAPEVQQEQVPVQKFNLPVPSAPALAAVRAPAVAVQQQTFTSGLALQQVSLQQAQQVSQGWYTYEQCMKMTVAQLKEECKRHSIPDRSKAKSKPALAMLLSTKGRTYQTNGSSNPESLLSDDLKRQYASVPKENLLYCLKEKLEDAGIDYAKSTVQQLTKDQLLAYCLGLPGAELNHLSKKKSPQPVGLDQLRSMLQTAKQSQLNTGPAPLSIQPESTSADEPHEVPETDDL